MSLVLRVLLTCALVACGGSSKQSDEPTTAKEKQLRQAKEKGLLEKQPRSSKSWGKWRYSGNRTACFFQVKGRCFKTENQACRAARCRKPKRCVSSGAGPAMVSCKAPAQ